MGGSLRGGHRKVSIGALLDGFPSAPVPHLSIRSLFLSLGEEGGGKSACEMGAGSSRADAPSRRRARLGLGWCFGAGSSSAAAAAARDGGSFAADAPSSSRANEVVVPVPRRRLARDAGARGSSSTV